MVFFACEFSCSSFLNAVSSSPLHETGISLKDLQKVLFAVEMVCRKSFVGVVRHHVMEF